MALAPFVLIGTGIGAGAGQLVSSLLCSLYGGAAESPISSLDVPPLGPWSASFGTRAFVIFEKRNEKPTTAITYSRKVYRVIGTDDRPQSNEAALAA